MEKPDMLFGHELVYKINKEKGTTVCYFKEMVFIKTSQLSIWESLIYQTLPRIFWSEEESEYANKLVKTIAGEFPKKFGKATCHEGDTWNEAIGRRHAKAQLRNRINRAKRNALLKWLPHNNNKYSIYANQCHVLIGKLNQSTNSYVERYTLEHKD